MRLSKYILPVGVALIFVAQFALWPAAAQSQGEAAAETKYVPVTEYDPKRDAARDIQDAASEAQRTRKRILLEVGGEWCSWCHRLDSFFEAHPDLIQIRDANFITVKINFSDANENQELLSHYPAIPGYPHIYILDSDGKLLHSQDTSALESGKSYDLDGLKAFLTKWAPAR